MSATGWGDEKLSTHNVLSLRDPENKFSGPPTKAALASDIFVPAASVLWRKMESGARHFHINPHVGRGRHNEILFQAPPGTPCLDGSAVSSLTCITWDHGDGNHQMKNTSARHFYINRHANPRSVCTTTHENAVPAFS
jgi:hypothetical protein